MKYVAKLTDKAGTVYGYGANDGAAVLDAVAALGDEPGPDVLLAVYVEYDDGAVDLRYVMRYGAYRVATA